MPKKRFIDKLTLAVMLKTIAQTNNNERYDRIRKEIT